MSNQFTPQIGIGKQYPILDDKSQTTCWAIVAILAIGTLLAYLNTLWNVADYWDEPQYSHGFMVPAFAAVLLWMRREPFREVPTWQVWIGVGLVAVGIATRVYGAYYVRFIFDNMSFVPCLMGIFVMVGGLPALRWSGPPIGFLVFMYPMPRFLEDGLMKPMQTLATMCSLFALQTFGVDAFREGNQIHLDNKTMGVVDQCSGLRMLTIFVALAVAIALIYTTRPWWERVIIVLSSVPIALAVNVIRITVVGLLYNLNIPHQYADMIMHDLAGWIMMPMALGLLFVEIQLLQRLVLEEDQTTAMRLSG